MKVHKNSPFKKVMVGKVPVDVITFDELISEIQSESSKPRYIAFVNAKSVVDANENPDYAEVLNKTWINSPDGMPVAKVVGRKNGKNQKRVSGPDVFEKFMDTRDESRHFLLGSSQEVLTQIIARADAQIVGTFSPEFKVPTNDDIRNWARMVTISGASHVWLGLGSPKQDISGVQLSELTNTTVLGVGAAFDFYSGYVSRAPRLIRDLGAEWLHRLFRNPKKMFRRYVVDGPKFIFIIGVKNDK